MAPQPRPPTPPAATRPSPGNIDERLKALPLPQSMTHAHLLALILGESLSRSAQPLQLLDAGCGDGLLLSYLARGLQAALPERAVQLHGFDVADSGHVVDGFPARTVKRLDEEVPGQPWSERIACVGVREPWPFPDGTFDIVCSNQVLEHVFDLDHFLNELKRCLLPGGASVHVFPLRRVLWECHTAMPLVHRARDRGTRRALIRAFHGLGLGRYRACEAQGFAPDAYLDMTTDIIQFACCYRSWAEIADAAKRAGLDASHEYTAGYYGQKLRSVAGHSPNWNYRSSHWFFEQVAFAALPLIASATIVLRRPVSTDLWNPHRGCPA